MKQSASSAISLTILAEAIGAQIHGKDDIFISGVNNLEGGKPGDLAYLEKERFLETALHSKASAIIVSKHYTQLPCPQLVVKNPQFAFVQIINQFFAQDQPAPGIAKEVWKGPEVSIGRDVSIGPFVTLGARARIGDRVTLYPGVSVGEDVTIGHDTVLYPRVTILDRCSVGNHVIIHSGTVIGSDGFGYLQHEGQHVKIPQRGTVIIEDDVELGANVTIDRATFGQTHIKRGCKIDNQVQIAHNVIMDEHCIIVAQVGIAGSTQLGKHVIIGGQAGLIDHLTIGDGAMIAAGAGIEKSVEPGAIMSGWPAKRHEVSLRTHVLVQRLPELHQQVANLEKRLATLENTKPSAKNSKTKKR
ncbi:UDP-3-O-(3-hydroxymyristoyl)glucosamine N-acyltransferase [Candidatus Nitronereus thalassa]|uniref:UDP-3-O-acylglucosamine N-acyltransferase n=1 Tax=Candidatus Nitronereus thalassa TaxID=3020898 RepID=A0ABU3K4I1_9BACT|nr:UDP-3-O-(3-hydroxymyristoyl)glucosamine N-acyltransferase [Candidatus Nitronereus thalassa]MDT7041272.1 UDP-3-O-(3-hydroxymyristoyl)glucosamine N-acyltransferase [Candidatus Nitronereus thalassa]